MTKKTTKKIVQQITKPDNNNAKKKAYVLDTNVLVHDPGAIFNFEGVLIGIPVFVLEELDSFKREPTDRGRNAREVIRILDDLRKGGSLGEGILLDNGATVKVLFPGVGANEVPTFALTLPVKDNDILLTAFKLQDRGYEVIFISKDLNARVKADALGLQTQDYLKEYVSEDEFYHGWREIQVPSVQLKSDDPAIFDELLKEGNLSINEYVLLTSRNNPHNYKAFRYLGGKRFRPVYEPSIKWPLRPRNPQQLMALDLLMDDSVPFVTLFGPAGTGKTFLALLAGLHKVLIEDEYQKMLISRPVVPLGRDIGYLPGDVKEKLHSWMLPIYDNMEFIIHSTNVGQHEEQQDHGKSKGKKRKQQHKRSRDRMMSLDEMEYRGKISMEAITYMRGRSIPYQFILIDEAQNLTPHEVKTIVSRVGEGSKIILAGDPYQIDAPYLDFSSNGLVIASERFRNNHLFGTVYLEVSERSELSQLTTDLL